MVMGGASLKAVQQHLGHTTLMMTQKYSHLSPDFQRSEVEGLNGLFDEGIESSKKLVRSEELAKNVERPESFTTA
jgi:hypothetical protein